MRTALLLSGGMRSTCLAWMYRPDIAIAIDYGQPAFAAELRSASAVCAELDIAMRVMSLREAGGADDDLGCSIVTALASDEEPWGLNGAGLIAAGVTEAYRLGASRLLIASRTRDNLALIRIAETDGNVLRAGLAEPVFPAIAHSTDALVKAGRVPGRLLLLTHNCVRSNTPCHDCPACDRASMAFLSIGFDLGFL